MTRETLVAWGLVVGLASASPRADEGVPRRSDWFQFLGPSRDGRIADESFVSGWLRSGLSDCFRVKVGEGYAGVSVSGDRLFGMEMRGGDEVVVSRRAEDGIEIWHRVSGPSPGNVYGGLGPRVTPTVHEDLVLTVSAQGNLMALDAGSGRPVWTRDLESELGFRPPAEGNSATPLVADGRVFVTVGGGAGRAVAAFEVEGGRLLWTSGDDRTSYSSPTLLTLGGEPQVLFLLGTRLVSFAPENGEVLWRYDWKTYDRVNVATPIRLDGDRVFISSGYDQGAAVIEVVKVGGKLQARELWQSRVMKNHFNNSVFLDGVIYGFDEAIFKAVDARTGELLFRARGFGKGSLIAAGDRLIVLSDAGELALVEPDRTELEVLARTGVASGRTWTPPSLSRGRLFVRSRRELVCLRPDG